MADLSKLRFNGTDYNVKDASAPLRKFTNYSKTGNLPITSDDTTQTAIGKLEKALDDKINTSAKGTSNGLAELDANGKVPSSQLPSYVDDVLEYSAKSSFPATGETGKIYVDTTTNKTYRWSGSAYVEISESLALGETSSTAYRGDRGKAAYDHSQITNGNPHGTTGANTKLTGYSKGSSKDAVAATDTVNAAIAKHENRINANQTNILYSLQTGVKNLFNPEASGNWQYGLSSYSADAKTGTISMATTASDWARTSVPITLPAGEYKFCGNVTALVGSAVITGNTSSSGQETAIFNNIELSTTGTFEISFTLNTETPFWIAVYANFSSSIVSNSVTITGMMICTKAAWDQEPNVYRPFARPNYDLTRLQVEDRAALVEVIDEGAKNLLNISGRIDTIKSQNVGGVWSGNSYQQNGITFILNNDGTISVSGTNSSSNSTNLILYNSASGIKEFTADNYALSGCPANGSNDSYSVYAYRAKTTNPVASYQDLGSGVVGYFDYTLAESNNSNIAIVIAGGYAISGTLTFKPMLCTEANWKISQNYAQYALPNTDLTRMMTPFFTVPINHNMIYRGANLGDTLTADQDTALSSGNFTDLYLGDYWTKQITIPAFYEVTTAEPADWSTNYTSYYTESGDTYTPVSGDTAPTWAANTYYERLVPSQTVTLKAVIADFDTFYAGYASNYAGINTHHAAVIVTGFNNVVWNKTTSTAGGYVASLIHKWLVGSVLPQMETWFGSAKVLSHQKLLTNAITGDAASGWAWSSQKISLLSENQMYGSKVWGNSKAANGGYEPGEAHKHLNVFNYIDANLLFGNKNIWLRDIASAVCAAALAHGGNSDYGDASSTGIAPAALILLS